MFKTNSALNSLPQRLVLVFLFLTGSVAEMAFAADTLYSIGKSVQGRDIKVQKFGHGSTAVVLTGGMHGTSEANTAELVRSLALHFAVEPPPERITVYTIENLNPDAFANSERKGNQKNGKVLRLNAHGVDLDRNWGETSEPFNIGLPERFSGDRWVPHSAVSEPETRSFALFLVGLLDSYENVNVINFHSYRYLERDRGFIYPAYTMDQGNEPLPDEQALNLANTFAEAAEFEVENQIRGVSGKFLAWAAINRVSAFDVELSDYEHVNVSGPGRLSHIEAVSRGLGALLQSLNGVRFASKKDKKAVPASVPGNVENVVLQPGMSTTPQQQRSDSNDSGKSPMVEKTIQTETPGQSNGESKPTEISPSDGTIPSVQTSPVPTESPPVETRSSPITDPRTQSPDIEATTVPAETPQE